MHGVGVNMAERENQKEHSPFRFPLSEPLPLLNPNWAGLGEVHKKRSANAVNKSRTSYPFPHNTG